MTPGPFAKLAVQLSRFGLVGAFNTALDFAVTNLLYIVFRPESSLGLIGISVTAVLVAATNSWFMNARWTFEGRVAEPYAPARFALVAFLGLVVNTAVFLFVVKYLHLFVEVGPVLTVNLAKLAGVGAAMAATFLGYRLGVFRSAGMLAFRDSLALVPATDGPRWGAVSAILLVALVARLAFLAMAPVVYGDAVTYSWVAWFTAHGELERVDTFWHSLFDFWQALLAMLGLDRYPMLVLSTLIPGTLLVVPVYLIGRRLFGEWVALLAASLVALHPRLVEYSVNGYGEMLYLFAGTWAVWALTALFQEPHNRKAAVVLGLGLAGWLLVRNEVVVLLGTMALLCLVAIRWKGLKLLPGLAVGALALATSTGLYVGTNLALWGGHGLFAKSSNVGKQHIETLDLAAAARETYGQTEPQAVAPPGPGERIAALLERWPRNLMYTAERLPGVLLSPLPLFALILPFLARRRGGPSGIDELPLLGFTLWPLLFYPLLQLEPRLLFPTLIGILVFASAGVLAFGRLLAGQLASRPGVAERAAPGLALAVVLLLVPAGAALAWQSHASRGYHREVGAWLKAHLPPDTPIAGDGYGYVSASTFWAGVKGEPRLWVDDPAGLAPWAREKGFPVLLLYEPYLREANPELLGALEQGVPGMERLHRFEFPRIGRVDVLALPELSVVQAPGGELVRE